MSEVTIKPLVWVADPDNDGDCGFFRAKMGDYVYEVGADENWWWQEDAVLECAATAGFSTADAAKAAAQADYEARILSCLDHCAPAAPATPARNDLREKLEAAEARIGGLQAAHNTMAMETAAAKAALTTARATQAAAWEAVRDAAAEATITARTMHEAISDILDLTPPADLSAALQRVRDEAWDGVKNAIEDHINNTDYGMNYHAPLTAFIRALRRAPTEDR